jgi:hypothetical protein
MSYLSKFSHLFKRIDDDCRNTLSECSSRDPETIPFHILSNSPFIIIVSSLIIIHSRSRALLEKPPIVQLLNNYPAFYGTRRFITVFTRAIHWSLSWAKSFQFMWVPCHHGMARPQVADEGDGLQIWRVAANILNKQLRTADKGWSSSNGGWEWG